MNKLPKALRGKLKEISEENFKKIVLECKVEFKGKYTQEEAIALLGVQSQNKIKRLLKEYK